VTTSTDRGWDARPGALVAVCLLVYAPFALLGFGTDIDVPNVLRSGRSWVEDGTYQMARGPGAVVHELSVGVLDSVGGSVLVNLASLGFAALALWALQGLARADGARRPAWAVAVLASNPWFWIAATSLGDFTWALGLVVAGALMARRGARVGAGVLFGLSLGCRASSVLLVLAWVLAERIGAEPTRASRREVGTTVATALLVGVIAFIPPWLAADKTLSFLDNQLEFVGVGVHLGRWAVKNLAFIGLPALVVLLWGIRSLGAPLARWRDSVVIRFAIGVVVTSELLFFRLPFKPVHLLPVAAALALVVALSQRASRRWVTALVVAQLVGGLVGLTVAAPDVESAARSGRFDVAITSGPILTDVRCRLDDRAAGPWMDPGSPAATARAEANADCLNATWRGE
jgi:hypothetical protein